MTMRHLHIPSWVLEEVHMEGCNKYLVVIHSDHDDVSVDGCHGDDEGVARARELFESIACIKPKEGAKYRMLVVMDVPELTTELNQDAISQLNRNFLTQRGLMD